MDTNEHKALRRYGDQYICSHCGKQWDVKDPDPPECNTMFEDAEKTED